MKKAIRSLARAFARALCLCTLSFIGLSLVSGRAQSGDRPTVNGGLTPTQEALAQDIGAALRCPVCQGMPIAESPAQMAQDMMRLVREKIAGGASRDEVEQYFVVRYGAWVLLRPPATGAGMWVWVLPPIALICALLALIWTLSRSRTAARPQEFVSPRSSGALHPQEYARVRTWLSEERD